MEPSGPVQDCNGFDLPLQYPTIGPHPDRLNAVNILVLNFIMTNIHVFVVFSVCSIFLAHLNLLDLSTLTLFGEVQILMLLFSSFSCY
jgi:hypothetical protein